jgi:iron(III) transport system ATP-binding protein
VTVAIELDAVTIEIGDRCVLDGVSLRVASGEVLAVLGPSGSGKTSLLRAVTGFLAPARGRIALDGNVVSRDGECVVPPEQRNLAMVFQDLALWPHLTVYGNLAFGFDARHAPRSERDVRIATMLEQVSLADKALRYPGDLSGGERQRVAIARALVVDPMAILFDEPLTSLDVMLKDELVAMVRSLLRERSQTAVYVTHDPAEALALGDRIAILEGGTLLQLGTADELRAAPASEFVRRALHATASR